MSHDQMTPAATHPLNVGPWRYQVSVTGGPLIVDGTPGHFAVLEHEQQILIAGDCPPHRRLAALGCGMMLAWTMAVGEPAGRDGWCSMLGTVVESLLMDLDACGGRSALVQLRPGQHLMTFSPKGGE